MNRKRQSPEQVAQKLRDADAMLAAVKTMGQVCQALEISEQTFHRWRNQYGGMKAGEAKRVKDNVLIVAHKLKRQSWGW